MTNVLHVLLHRRHDLYTAIPFTATARLRAEIFHLDAVGTPTHVRFARNGTALGRFAAAGETPTKGVEGELAVAFERVEG